jgi:hypothetical protein
MSFVSMAFHRRRGFRVTKENGKGVEFFAAIEELAADPSIERTSQSRFRRLYVAAHVELQGLPHLSSGTDPR